VGVEKMLKKRESSMGLKIALRARIQALTSLNQKVGWFMAIRLVERLRYFQRRVGMKIKSILFRMVRGRR